MPIENFEQHEAKSNNEPRDQEGQNNQAEDILLNHSDSWTFDESAKEIAGYASKKALAESLSKNRYSPNAKISISAKRGMLGLEVDISIDGKIFKGVHPQSKLSAFMDAIESIEPATGSTDISKFLEASKNWNLPEKLNTAINKASLAKALKENKYSPHVKISISAKRGMLGLEVDISIDGKIFKGVHPQSKLSAFMDAIESIEPATGSTDISKFLEASKNWNLPEKLNTAINKASLAKALKENKYSPHAKISMSAKRGMLGLEVDISIDGKIFKGVHPEDVEKAFLDAISSIRKK